ncbi:MAG: tetratricopeptide repeat protein, partial [Acidobacteriota bacterium]|nr:tetratricopeptide repeat protein [Acidobacteriota bacterium]
MRNILVIFAGIIVGGIVAVFGVAAIKERAPRLANPLTQVLETTGNFRPSPADRQIRAAQGMIEQTTSEPRGYNLLSDAFMQKARESGDFSFNSRAEAALKRSEELAPDNYDALKLRAKLLLTYHRFREALAVAERAQAKNPKDDDVYGALTDALVEIGDYPAAVKAAQTMVDLRPNTASYSRVSYLRSLHGETEGA